MDIKIEITPEEYYDGADSGIEIKITVFHTISHTIADIKPLVYKVLNDKYTNGIVIERHWNADINYGAPIDELFNKLNFSIEELITGFYRTKAKYVMFDSIEDTEEDNEE